jgi:hypothetical protein
MIIIGPKGHYVQKVPSAGTGPKGQNGKRYRPKGHYVKKVPARRAITSKRYHYVRGDFFLWSGTAALCFLIGKIY